MVAVGARGAQGRQRIGGLARLRDHHRERRRIRHRLAVAVFARDVDFDMDARQLFDEAFAEQGRMPRRAAGEQDDVPHRAEIDAEIRFDQAPAEQAAVEDAGEDLGLLGDLLGHEGVVAALGHRIRGDFDRLEGHRDRNPGEGRHRHALGRHVRDLAIGEEHHLGRMRQQSRHVGGDHRLAAPAPDQERRSAPHRDDPPGFVGAEHREGELAFQFRHRRDHRSEQVASSFLVFGDELRNHLGVGLRREHVPGGLQFLAQIIVVFDDPVMHHRDRSLVVQVRMAVDLIRRPVRRPARVADAAMTAQGGGLEQCRQAVELARRLAQAEASGVLHHHPRRIVTAVFQPFERHQQDLVAGLGSGVSGDAAHGECLAREVRPPGREPASDIRIP